jgi:hypothetical protein
LSFVKAAASDTGITSWLQLGQDARHHVNLTCQIDKPVSSYRMQMLNERYKG